MTGEQLAEIESRLKAITPGEWWVEYREQTYADGMVDHAPIVTTHDVDIAIVSHDVDADEDVSRDAEFIAHAPNDIAALLAMVDALTVERDALATQLREAQDAAKRQAAYISSCVDSDGCYRP